MSHPYREPCTPMFYSDPEPRKPYVRVKSRLPLWPMLSVLLVSSTTYACSLFTPQNAQTALDIAKVVCVLANAESDDQTVKTVCGILDAEDAAFRQVLGEQRKASRRLAASRCQDAGTTEGGADSGR